MVEGVITAIFAGLLWVFGVWVGSHAHNDSWTNDCQTIQIHRDGKDVYKCEKVK